MSRALRFGAWRFRPDAHALTNGSYSASLEPRVARLLEFLLNTPDEVLSHDRLVDTVWDGRVVSDEAVRRAVSSLRRVLAYDGSDRFIETVHKKGYIARLPCPNVEEAEESAATAPLSDTDTGASDRRARRLVLPIAAGLLVAVASAYLLHSWLIAPEPVAEQPYTIAVLPFTNLSDEPDAQYFSDGLSQELLGLLARYSAFRVTAGTSSFRFRDRNEDVQSIAKQLKVYYLVEGSVRKDGDRARIGAHLIDARTGFQLWAERYESTLEDVLTVQETIAREVARTLRVVLVERAGSQRDRSAGSTEAYLDYLRGLSLTSSWVTEDLEAAVGHFRAAIALDPGLAAAYVQLGEAMLKRATDSMTATQLSPVVRSLVEKALELDPQLGEAYVLRAHFQEDLTQAEADFRHGLSLAPSYAPGYGFLAESLFFRWDRREEGLEMIDRAIALDPLRARHYHVKALMATRIGEFEDASALEEQALRIDPRFRSAIVLLSHVDAVHRGDYARALLRAERAFEIDPRSDWIRSVLVASHLNLGDPAGARLVNRTEVKSGDLLLAVFDGRWRDAAELIYAHDPDHGPLSGTYWGDPVVLLGSAVHTGDFQRAADHARAYEKSVENIARLIAAELRHLAGDETALPAVESLQRAIHDELERHPGLAVVNLPCLALVEASHGRDEQALTMLERALEPGDHLPSWWLFLDHPAFDGIRENPRYQALATRTREYNARQRERLVQLRAGPG